MGIIKEIKEIISSKKGVTYIEVMLAVTLLGISMTYLAYDSRYSSKMLYELSEKDHMLYAAQEAVEQYKLDQNGANKTINGYNVSITSTLDNTIDPNLTQYLKRATFTVYPKNSSSGMNNLELISYVFVPNATVPDQPNNVTATPTVNTIVLNWDSVSYADTYSIVRSTQEAGTYTQIAAGLGTNTYTDTNVTPQTTYFYKVIASNAYGNSAESNVASAVILYNTVILNPSADSYIRNGTLYAGSNYGTQQQLMVREWNKNGEIRKTYIKFDLSSISGMITDAKLRVRGRNISNSSNTILNVKALSNDGWTESGVTWNNAPLEGAVLVTLPLGSAYSYAEVSVKDYVASEYSGDKQASFVITGIANDLIEINSRESAYMPELVITTTPSTAPQPPQNLKGNPDDKKAILVWDTSMGATSYNIKRSTASGGPYITVKTAVSGTSYTDISLSNGTTYYYVVSAVNSSGESANSSWIDVIPNILTTVIYNPSADSYTRDGSYSTSSYGSVAKLEVKNGTAGEKREAYLRFDLTNLRGAVTNAKLRLFAGNMDDISQVNLNIYDVSDNSWQENVITYSSAPLSGSQIASLSVDNFQGYREVDISEYIKNETLGDKIVGIKISAVDPGKLISINSRESLSNKPELVITKTLLKPEAPTNLRAVPDDRLVTLDWVIPDEALSYIIKRSGTDGGPSYTTIASNITTNTYTDTTVTNGTKYYYVVTAINAAGESANSNQVSVTPNVITTVTLNPTADNRVESYYPNNNYGPDTVLGIVNNGLNDKKSYLKFDMSGYTNNTVVSAKLRIYANSSVSQFKVNAHKVSDNSWIETGTGSIRWSNAPTLENIISSFNVNTTKQYYETDITEYIALQLVSSNLISIGLFTDIVSGDNLSLNSKENSLGKPELVLKMAPGIPKPPTELLGIGSNRTAKLSWAVSDGALSYKVKRSPTKGGPYTTVAQNIITNSYTETGLKNGSEYYYVVSAVNSVGESVNSNEECLIPVLTGNSQILLPTDDSYVRDGLFGGTNYGGAQTLEVSSSSTADSGNARVVYLKFDLPTVDPSLKSAVLNISGKNITDNKNIAANVFEVPNDDWEEYAINWYNAPSPGPIINSIVIGKSYGTISVDLTNFMKAQLSGDEVLSICIKAATLGLTGSFDSKESLESPTIQITY